MGKRNHNEGSIRERKDGRFEVRVTARINFETGKAKRISYYAGTKAEAVKLLHEVEYNIHINEMVDPTSTKLIDWLKIWLETYMKNSLKQSLIQVMPDISIIILPPLFQISNSKTLLQNYYRSSITTSSLRKVFHPKQSLIFTAVCTRL